MRDEGGRNRVSAPCLGRNVGTDFEKPWRTLLMGESQGVELVEVFEWRVRVGDQAGQLLL